MQRRIGLIVALAAAGLFGLTGCKDKAKELSAANAQLARQHKVWNNALASLRSEEPNLELVRAAEGLLLRTHRRVGMDYPGANRQEVLDKLKGIADRFAAEVAPKVNLGAPLVVLRPGVTMDEVRDAFEKLNEEYQELVAMAPGAD